MSYEYYLKYKAYLIEKIAAEIRLRMTGSAISQELKFSRKDACLRMPYKHWEFDVFIYIPIARKDDTVVKFVFSAEYRISSKKLSFCGQIACCDLGTFNTDMSLDLPYDDICSEIRKTVFDLHDRFVSDSEAAVKYLLDEKLYEYNVDLDCMSRLFGTDLVMPYAEEMARNLTPEQHEFIEEFRSQNESSHWQLPHNLEFLVANGQA